MKKVLFIFIVCFCLFGLFGTMLFSGVGQVVGDWISGNLTSFDDGLKTFIKAALGAGLSYGISKAVSVGFGKIQMKHKLLKSSGDNHIINGRIKKLSGSYGKALSGMKIGRNTMEEFLEKLAFTNSNMAVTQTANGIISVLFSIGDC